MTFAHSTEPELAAEGTKPVLTVVPPARGVVGDKTVELAIRLVDQAEVTVLIATWKAQEAKGPGGRPATFSYRALLVGLVVCAITDQPLHLTRVCDVMFRQLSSKWRVALDIPDPPADDTLGWAARYRNVRTRFADLIDLVDPSDTPKNRRLDHETYASLVEQRRAGRSDEDRTVRYQRLECLINRLLQASLSLLPPTSLQQWKGSVGVDATLIVSHARPQRQLRRKKPKHRPVIVTHSADPDAAWYSRLGDHRDDNGDAPGGQANPKVAWGYEATLAISGSDDPDLESVVPSLALGMAVLHKPGHDVGRNGVRALAQVRAFGHPAGFLAADRAYSNAKPDDFQLPARALGYRPVYDYKIDQLGIMHSSQGFVQIEGHWYCPSIPQPLIDATIDFRLGRIDEDTYRARLTERWGYLARPKGKPDAEGYVRFACPAANPWPMARCDLKPASTSTKTQGRPRIPLKSDIGAAPPPSCSQQSVTIPPEAGAKLSQELLYGSAEWHAVYATLRNSNEGFHGYVKDPAHEALDDPARRRVHGVAAQSLCTALLLLAANVRKIRTFLKQNPTPLPPAARPRARRRRSASLDHWRPKGMQVTPPSTSDPPVIA